jgi:hypothetical protein
MDIFLNWQHYFLWISHNCTSTKDIDEARGKLGLYIIDYYIFVSLSTSLLFLQHLVCQQSLHNNKSNKVELLFSFPPTLPS